MSYLSFMAQRLTILLLPSAPRHFWTLEHCAEADLTRSANGTAPH